MNDEAFLVEREVSPPLDVEVRIGHSWWPGAQHAWRMYDDGTGWRAAVRFVVSSGPELTAREADVPVECVRRRRAVVGTA